jgi:hypothetical protein
MKPFEKILIVYDNESDNRALIEQATDIALKNQAVLTVIDVIEKTPQDFVEPVIKPMPGVEQKPQIQIIEDFISDSINSTTIPLQKENLKDGVGKSENERSISWNTLSRRNNMAPSVCRCYPTSRNPDNQ